VNNHHVLVPEQRACCLSATKLCYAVFAGRELYQAPILVVEQFFSLKHRHPSREYTTSNTYLDSNFELHL
jgi:hypothetical protein